MSTTRPFQTSNHSNKQSSYSSCKTPMAKKVEKSMKSNDQDKENLGQTRPSTTKSAKVKNGKNVFTSPTILYQSDQPLQDLTQAYKNEAQLPVFVDGGDFSETAQARETPIRNKGGLIENREKKLHETVKKSSELSGTVHLEAPSKPMLKPKLVQPHSNQPIKKSDSLVKVPVKTTKHDANKDVVKDTVKEESEEAPLTKVLGKIASKPLLTNSRANVLRKMR